MACRYADECLTGILGCDCVKAQREAEEKAAPYAHEDYELEDGAESYSLANWLGEFDDDPDLWNKGERE